MKKILILSSMLFAGLATQAQVKMPAASPSQTINQSFALGNIEVKYSRPIVKGRQIFGDLVPFGKVWRTGANGATLISFTDAVEFAGKKLDSGTYALYTIPAKDNWVVILNKGITNWGSTGYKTEDDVLRVTVPVSSTSSLVESFTIQIDNILPESCTLKIQWEKTSVSVPITSNVKDRIRESLESAIKNSEQKPYWQAMQFYNDWDNNPKKALEYAESAIKENPKAFYIWLYKARLEKATGNKKAALESSKTSLELAKQAQNDDYIKLNEEFQKELK